ncbi:hypothetical protein K1719_003140 [Acacia pycnantha]|nr:hypothetical protein K1719_003140 [Acacia pycnantha]
MKEASQTDPSIVVQPPACPPRHQKWKAARMKGDKYVNADVAEVAHKIDSLEQQSSQGSFTPATRMDILSTAIGKPDFVDAVRGEPRGIILFRSHTGSLRNIENVWKVEQKHDAEQKKLVELCKQIQEERERTVFRPIGMTGYTSLNDFLLKSIGSLSNCHGPTVLNVLLRLCVPSFIDSVAFSDCTFRFRFPCALLLSKPREWLPTCARKQHLLRER